ncbi:unnamed protein product [Adineta steineri]|uniref:Ankyrin repeat domain-containing protein 42 n=1 Tax=Adineta steineri TaxID=433720 RepID=A0A815WWB0_9BILA|nr:unnamed protein product [Adineta steineri]CAF1549783.1 unnamed protein product [Adineta steineri]CAF1660750.1 unnamed protein product [Adineta steineri]CAF1660764.1 unnamed protein product [Adineta steineri]
MTQTKDKPVGKTIHELVRENNVKDLELIVGRGAGVNEIDLNNDDKFTPLHWAAYAGSLEAMHWLLWQAANMDAATAKGWTPAHIAAIRGHDACVQALINNNVNINTRDRRQQTCLHMACAHGNSFVAHTLLRGGAEINHQDVNGWTPAFTAAYHGRLGCLQMLVKWGAKLNDVDNEGNTAAHLAALEGHLPCLKFIIAVTRDIPAVLGARNDQGDTPKSLAEQFYKEDCCKYLDALEWEQDHPEQAENLAFPAHVAAYNGDLEHVKLLVEQGVINVNERDEHGSTLAHKAAGQGHLDILYWLLENGANMDLQSESGETPKDVARRYGQLACLKLLGGGAEKSDGTQQSGQNEVKRQSEQKRLTPKEEERRRAKTKLDDLQKQIDIAKKNFRQFGGHLDEDEQREAHQREMQKKFDDYETQLEFERLKREKLEAELDECRHEIARLINTIRSYEERMIHVQQRPPSRTRTQKTKKPSSASSNKQQRRVEKQTGLVFIRRNSVNS